MKKVLTLRQIRQLRDKGFDLSNALLYLRASGDIYMLHEPEDPAFTPVYTLVDILERLPRVIYADYSAHRLRISHTDIADRYEAAYVSISNACPLVSRTADEPIDAAFLLLLWCIDNQHIKTQQQ